MGLVPAGSFANRTFCEQRLQVAPGIDPLLVDLCSDAQTNGGLLLAVAPDQAEAFLDCLKAHGIHAAAIGAVTGQGPGKIRLEP
jgi:selenide,water dikinase